MRISKAKSQSIACSYATISRIIIILKFHFVSFQNFIFWKSSWIDGNRENACYASEFFWGCMTIGTRVDAEEYFLNRTVYEGMHSWFGLQAKAASQSKSLQDISTRLGLHFFQDRAPSSSVGLWNHAICVPCNNLLLDLLFLLNEITLSWEADQSRNVLSAGYSPHFFTLHSGRMSFACRLGPL